MGLPEPPPLELKTLHHWQDLHRTAEYATPHYTYVYNTISQRRIEPNCDTKRIVWVEDASSLFTLTALLTSIHYGSQWSDINILTSSATTTSQSNLDRGFMVITIFVLFRPFVRLLLSPRTPPSHLHSGEETQTEQTEQFSSAIVGSCRAVCVRLHLHLVLPPLPLRVVLQRCLLLRLHFGDALHEIWDTAKGVKRVKGVKGREQSGG